MKAIPRGKVAREPCAVGECGSVHSAGHDQLTCHSASRSGQIRFRDLRETDQFVAECVAWVALQEEHHMRIQLPARRHFPQRSAKLLRIGKTDHARFLVITRTVLNPRQRRKQALRRWRRGLTITRIKCPPEYRQKTVSAKP